MDTHKNAPLTPKGREAMVGSVSEGGLTKAAAALQFNVTAKTVAKWVKRFREEGVDGLRDRSSRPHSSCSGRSCVPTESARMALNLQMRILESSECRVSLLASFSRTAQGCLCLFPAESPRPY